MTAPMLPLRYRPEPAMAMSSSATPAVRATNKALCATPVAKPPGNVTMERRAGDVASPFYVRRQSTKASIAYNGARTIVGLHCPVRLIQ